MRSLFFLLLALASAAAQQAVPSTPRISGGVMAGQLLTSVPPVYPQAARDAHVSGSVVMHAIISSEGAVRDLTVVSGPEMLRDAAMDAVKQWTYKPFVLNGRTTDVDTTITVNFSLTAASQGEGSSGTGPMQPALPTLPAGRVRVSSRVMAGQQIKMVQPVFPTIAKTEHISGALVFNLLIGKDGKVKELSVIAGPEVLRERAAEAVRQWEYKPYLLNGERVEVETQILMNIDFGG